MHLHILFHFKIPINRMILWFNEAVHKQTPFHKQIADNTSLLC